MKIFDTHAHFGGDESSIAAIIDNAVNAGVTKIMAVGGSDELNTSALLAKKVRPETMCLALGFDRDQASTPEANEKLIERIKTFKNISAIGEAGLDFFYSPDNASSQCDLFARELQLADELALPIVIHTRQADDATLGVLDEVPWRHTDKLRGIIHCYTGSVALEKKLLDRGFMISISGIVTFKAADNVREAALYVPDDRLLVETDSPFLAPVPMRGKENEPAFITHTVKFISELRKTSPEILSALTFANAEVLLNGLNDKHYA
jgi:TatD DNase family protein